MVIRRMIIEEEDEEELLINHLNQALDDLSDKMLKMNMNDKHIKKEDEKKKKEIFSISKADAENSANEWIGFGDSLMRI